MIRAALVALGLMLCFAAPAHAEFGNCRTDGYLRSFDPRFTPTDCDVVTTATIRWHGGSARLRAIHPRSTAMTDSAIFIARVNEAAAAIGSAIDAMGSNVHLDDVTILFSNQRSPHDDSADQGWYREGYLAAVHSLFAAECPVTWYKDTVRNTGDDFVFVVAHEVFHCIQLKSWPSMRGDWLIEGGAEYFAYLARPNYNRDDSIIGRFDSTIFASALDHQSYSAVVFWLWLGQTTSPAHVRDFFSAARSVESSVTPDQWIQFGQAYFDQTIRMPGGARLIPSRPAPGGTNRISHDEYIHTPVVTPFTLNNAFFVFDRNKNYQLGYPNTPPDARMVWRREGSSTWTTPPASISTCDGEARYRVIFTTTRSNHFGDIDVHAQAVAPGMCTCPAGTWRETSESTRQSVEQSAFAGASHTQYISGTRVLTLNPDHSGSLTYVDLISETHTPGDPAFWLRQTKTGGTHFTWRVVGGMLLAILRPGNNLLNMHNEQHSRSGVLVENRPGGAQSIGHQFSCDASGLHLRQHAARPSVPGMPVSNYSVDMDFVRLGAPPGH